MRRQDSIDPRDARVLLLTRVVLDQVGSQGDLQLVENLGRYGIPPREARESLVRLEATRHLRFGASGWSVPAPVLPIFPFPSMTP